MIKCINTIPNYSTILMVDGGFKATILIDYFRLCIAIFIIFIQDGKVFQIMRSYVNTGLVLTFCTHMH